MICKEEILFELDQLIKERKRDIDSLELVEPKNKMLKPYITGRLDELYRIKQMINEKK